MSRADIVAAEPILSGASMSQAIHTPGSYTDHYDDHHDRVRWPAIIAGLFGTLSVLAVLMVLGTAIGLSAVDQNSDARNFAIGAGIWGAISMLIAFAFGGWLAARSSDPYARGKGMLQSAMVWMVSVALLTYILGAGLGSLTRSAAQGTAANTDMTSRVQTDTPALGVDTNVNRAQTERTAEQGARGAWGTLIAMLLGLGAAMGGGYLGSRRQDDGEDHTHHTSVTGRPATAG
jgi:MFS family permease